MDKSCPVCLIERAIKPLSLHCGHIFCEMCVNNILKNTKKDQPLACPVCRETHQEMTGFMSDKNYTSSDSDNERSEFMICPRCKVNVRRDRFHTHKETKCIKKSNGRQSYRIMFCPNNCGSWIKRSKIYQHLEQKCPHRNC